MKKANLIFLLILFISVSILLNVKSSCQNNEIKLQKITDHLYMISRAGGNIAFLANEEGVLVVDSGNKPDNGKKILNKIHEVTDKPIKYLVFTHYHGDHIFGAQNYPESTTVISHENTRINIKNVFIDNKSAANLDNPMNAFPQLIKDLEQKIEKLKAEKSSELNEAQQELEKRKQQFEDFKQQKYILPQITFEKNCTIYLGNDVVQLLYFSAGHTNGDVIVYFPAEQVIHVGDLFFLNNWVPRLDAEAGASVDNWLKIFDKVLELAFEKVIPGHGEITDREGFIKRASLSMAYLKDLKSEVEKYVSQGASLEQIKEKLKLPKYEDIELYEILLPYNIDGAYEEIIANKKSQ